MIEIAKKSRMGSKCNAGRHAMWIWLPASLFLASLEGPANAQPDPLIRCPSISGDAEQAACFAEADAKADAKGSASPPPLLAADPPPPAHCPSAWGPQRNYCFEQEDARVAAANNPPPQGQTEEIPAHCPSLSASAKQACFDEEDAKVRALKRPAPSPPPGLASIATHGNCPSRPAAARASCLQQEEIKLQGRPAALQSEPSAPPPNRCPSLAKAEQAACFAAAK